MAWQWLITDWSKEQLLRLVLDFDLGRGHWMAPLALNSEKWTAGELGQIGNLRKLGMLASGGKV